MTKRITQKEMLTRGVDTIVSVDELEKLLLSKKKLRIKFGVDPTAADIHLGHTVVLRKLRWFQDMGHTIIFLIGDATARIGDPSGKNQTRPVLSDAEISENAQTYLSQVGKILDVDKAEIRRNSEWSDKLTFAGLLKLATNFTVAQLIERDDFSDRLARGQQLSLHELLYPVLQANDSVELKADIEFGGTDQRFNILAGRDLQRKVGQKPQVVFLTTLLVGTDGARKMSKSLGNYIALSDSPKDMYGKLMSISDELIKTYFELCTDVPQSIIDSLVQDIANGANPLEAKRSLAREIVGMYHGLDQATQVEAEFISTFTNKQLPSDIADIAVSKTDDILDIIVGGKMAPSRTAARRLLEQGGVKLAGKTIQPSDSICFKDQDILQVGKRRFGRIKLR